MKFFRKKRMFALLLAGFLILLFYETDWLGRWIYPIKYEEDIKISAEQFGIDPLLVASIIRVESNFKPNLVSRKNAVGLMQLMPETAQWIIETANYADLTIERIAEEDVNIHLGTWYLRHLFTYFENFSRDKPPETRLAVVVAAYNAGPGNVEKWLHEGTWDGDPDHAEMIPFGETRHYVQRVLYYYQKYRSIYADEWYG